MQFIVDLAILGRYYIYSILFYVGTPQNEFLIP